MKPFANRRTGTDIEPYEVIRTIGAKTLEIREMKAELHPDWKPESIGFGFYRHVSNICSQKWIITSDPDNKYTIKIRLHKDGFYYDADGDRYYLSEEPEKFYDYNLVRAKAWPVVTRF